MKFSFTKGYDYSPETEDARRKLEQSVREIEEKKRIIEGEISIIKQEMTILNNELIKKYYDFSDYENITSQDCKNKNPLRQLINCT